MVIQQKITELANKTNKVENKLLKKTYLVKKKDVDSKINHAEIRYGRLIETIRLCCGYGKRNDNMY